MSNKFKIYEVEQRLIDFLRGDGEFADRPSKEVDKQVYSHHGINKIHTDKYFGVIIEYKGFSMFAPITQMAIRNDLIVMIHMTWKKYMLDLVNIQVRFYYVKLYR